MPFDVSIYSSNYFLTTFSDAHFDNITNFTNPRVSKKFINFWNSLCLSSTWCCVKTFPEDAVCKFAAVTMKLLLTLFNSPYLT